MLHNVHRVVPAHRERAVCFMRLLSRLLYDVVANARVCMLYAIHSSYNHVAYNLLTEQEDLMREERGKRKREFILRMYDSHTLRCTEAVVKTAAHTLHSVSYSASLYCQTTPDHMGQTWHYSNWLGTIVTPYSAIWHK